MIVDDLICERPGQINGQKVDRCNKLAKFVVTYFVMNNPYSEKDDNGTCQIFLCLEHTKEAEKYIETLDISPLDSKLKCLL